MLNDQVMMDPVLLWKAIEQSHRIGSEYAAIPFPSYEQMCFHPRMEYFEKIDDKVCFQWDDIWDDENIIVCLRPLGHDGQCGKPRPRQPPRGRVE